VWLGSARMLNPGVFGFSCMVNLSVFGFSLYAEPRCGWVQLQAKPKKRLGVGCGRVIAKLGSWARRKHNPILGYDFHVMAFK